MEKVFLSTLSRSKQAISLCNFKCLNLVSALSLNLGLTFANKIQFVFPLEIWKHIYIVHFLE